MLITTTKPIKWQLMFSEKDVSLFLSSWLSLFLSFLSLPLSLSLSVFPPFLTFIIPKSVLPGSAAAPVEGGMAEEQGQ